MRYDPNDVSSWPAFKPLIIAHDVGRSHDRSTAVVGGNSPYGRRLLGIGEAQELPQNQFGSARASALATVDRKYDCNGLIVADLSFDPTYAEVLYETFRARVIGLHITRGGDGMNAEWRPVKHGCLAVYTIGRSYLLELFLNELRSDLVRFADGPALRRAYEQLANLETALHDSGTVYTCPSGQHDDLGISCAMLAWAARHPHLVDEKSASRPPAAQVGVQLRLGSVQLATLHGVPQSCAPPTLADGDGLSTCHADRP